MTDFVIDGIGHLRTRLTLETRQIQSDNAGGYTTSWHKVGEIWGQVKTSYHRRQIVVGDELLEITHKIIIRYRDDINQRMRLRYGKQIFRVLFAYDPDMKKRFTVCLCLSYEPDINAICS